MITGTVTSEHEAVVRLALHNGDGQSTEADALIDTGFTGYLTLPLSLIESLGLPFQAPIQAMLADGTIIAMDYYRAIVDWNGQPRAILALAAEGGALIGMSLLENHDLKIEVVAGGTVTIESRA